MLDANKEHSGYACYTDSNRPTLMTFLTPNNDNSILILSDDAELCKSVKDTLNTDRQTSQIRKACL